MSRNWAGTHTYAAPRREAPHTEAELAALVRGSDRVHALGTRHSFTDLPDTTGTLIDMSGWRRPAVIDEQSRTVRVSAGTRYGVLAAQLHEAGWALHNTGSLPHISVGGATSTGTHGSGDRKGVLSTAIRALRFMDGNGELRTVERGEDDFAALAVGVGAFGVLTELTLEIEPTYQVQQNIYGALTWQDALDSIDELTSAGDSVSLFTRWDDIVWLWIKRRVAALRRATALGQAAPLRQRAPVRRRAAPRRRQGGLRTTRPAASLRERPPRARRAARSREEQ